MMQQKGRRKILTEQLLVFSRWSLANTLDGGFLWWGTQFFAWALVLLRELDADQRLQGWCQKMHGRQAVKNKDDTKSRDPAKG